MTYAETCRRVAVVQALWPHQRLATETPKVWHPFLEGFGELAAEGREWPPPIGVIVKTLVDRATEIPECNEARQELDCRIRRHGSYRLPPEETFSHPIVAAFARLAWQELYAGRAPGTNGHGSRRHSNARRFKALRVRAQRDTGLAAIGAARRSGLRRLTPGVASVLPSQEDAA